MPGLRDLLDASVWVPLAAPDHAHHQEARRYWEDESAVEVVFCRVTSLAFLRHLMSPLVMHHAVLTPAQAWEQYLAWRHMPGVFPSRRVSRIGWRRSVGPAGSAPAE